MGIQKYVIISCFSRSAVSYVIVLLTCSHVIFSWLVVHMCYVGVHVVYVLFVVVQLLTLCDTDDVSLAKLPCYKSVPLLVPLRVSGLGKPHCTCVCVSLSTIARVHIIHCRVSYCHVQLQKDVMISKFAELSTFFS